MKTIILIFILLLSGCDLMTETINGCTRREVEGIDCIVCGNGHSVDCNWDK